MLEDFFFYFRIGMEHVLEWGALDHILFLICLCVPFVLKDWLKVLTLVTFFTLGHTVSLLLGAFGLVSLKTNFVEFLIPITIFIAALANIFTAGRITSQNKKLTYGLALFFGTIHGLAYYGDLKMVLGSEGKVLKILEISLGVETAQLIIAGFIIIVGTLMQYVVSVSKRDWVMVVSAVTLGLILPMIIENKFW